MHRVITPSPACRPESTRSWAGTSGRGRSGRACGSSPARPRSSISTSPSRSRPAVTESPWSRIRSASLSTKLILFSALLTALAVAVAFLALSLELRKHTKRLLAQTLSQHQRMLLEVQRQGLEELLRASTLMSDSPTLRAAMETYRSELTPHAHPRADLLATIQREAEKIAGGLGRDLLIVTDRDGRVLAVGGRLEDRPGVGEDLSSRLIVRPALAQDRSEERRVGKEGRSRW